MIRIMFLTGAFISPEQVLERHYFLEVLNRPEYIWGIRAVGVMTVILAVFLYLKLKENAGELIMMSTDTSENAADAEPISETTSEPTSEPDVEQVAEITLEPTPAPNIEQVPELTLETSPKPDIEQVPELTLETSPEPDTEQVMELSSELSDMVDSERTPNRQSKPKHVSSHEKEILLLALLGISVGGLILFTCGRKKGKR